MGVFSVTRRSHSPFFYVLHCLSLLVGFLQFLFRYEFESSTSVPRFLPRVISVLVRIRGFIVHISPCLANAAAEVSSCNSQSMMYGQMARSDETEVCDDLEAVEENDVDLDLELEYELNALENDDDGGDSAPSDGVGVRDEVFIPNSGGYSGQLVISYAGQVYVFDNVDHEKAQDALYLLGISGTWLGDTIVGRNCHRQGKREPPVPGRCSQLQRLASLERFRQKRMKRCFEKKIRYDVRHEVALGMQRSRGQFASKKTVDDSGPSNCLPNSTCTHCGTGSNCTPMMRGGPAGPKTLCNACGNYWKNHGYLRDSSN